MLFIVTKDTAFIVQTNCILHEIHCECILLSSVNKSEIVKVSKSYNICVFLSFAD